MKYYNVILKVRRNGNTAFLKYRNVNRLEKLIQLVEERGEVVEYVNLYDVRTKEKIDSYYYRKSV